MGASKETLSETSGKNSTGHGKWDEMPVPDQGGAGSDSLWRWGLGGEGVECLYAVFCRPLTLPAATRDPSPGSALTASSPLPKRRKSIPLTGVLWILQTVAPINLFLPYVHWACSGTLFLLPRKLPGPFQLPCHSSG